MTPSSRQWLIVVAVVVLMLTGCTSDQDTRQSDTTRPAPTTTTAPHLPSIDGVSVSAAKLGNYEMQEMGVGISAEYENPYDQREVSLDAVFVGPDGTEMEVPGFWDGREQWKVRFTPSQVGEWGYRVTVSDQRGLSPASTGSFVVNDSERRGWLQIGDTVDPSYSSHYLAWSDGTPWYGRGHADLDMGLGGADPEGPGLRLFNAMPETGENYVMWWPTWGNNFTAQAYEDYSTAQLEIIDFVLREAETSGATLVYTIWTHQYLRTDAHPWGDSRWPLNGFSKLTDIAGFFTDGESLAWQENYYRYIIARWGYSPAIAMWQTITEINGTESYDQTNPWHENLNAYFQENDPYRHPTTATMSGSVDWPEGHAVMDVPQVHLYEFLDDPIEAAAQFARWTELMWDREEKPNWVGEYGNRGQQFYPEMLHHSNWASLGAGAAMTPSEWNDGASYGRFDHEMAADMARLATFVEEVPLVTYDPARVGVTSSDPELRGWAVAGDTGGILWVQDFALEGSTMDEIRADHTVRTGVSVALDRLAGGTWTITPFDTWAGVWMEPMNIDCPGDQPCQLTLPDFSRDIAFKLIKN
ncbi:MAG: DUF5060 domain-containing protein [Acidimicrobiia bacterium]